MSPKPRGRTPLGGQTSRVIGAQGVRPLGLGSFFEDRSMVATSCPSAGDLKMFRQGRLSEPASLQVEQHLPGCASCLERMGGMAHDDALVLGLRAQKGRPRLSNPLMEKARQEARAKRYRRAAVDQPTEASVATDATLAAPPGGLEGAMQGAPTFLGPPRGSGEIGWLGPYRVLRVLGEGGMGMVLEGEDSRLQRKVALKIMKPILAADGSARLRFLREARATAKLEHDHIVAIHQIDEFNGLPYLAMPLLQGEPLEARLARESLFSLAEVLRIGRETAQGLAAAHEKGLIHRDIKPGNLWLEAPSGRVKVLDFGLAAMPCPEGEKTLPGTILGTPGFMAPEQADGEADHRADLFSLGVVLYRMATGRMPFKGDTPMKKIRSTLFDTPEPPQTFNPAIPQPLAHLIMRLLSRKPQDRPATAVAVARVLESLEGQLLRGGFAATAVPALNPDPTVPIPPVAIPVAVPTPTPGPAPMKFTMPPLNRRTLSIAGAALAVLLVVAVVPFLLPRPTGPKETKEDTKTVAQTVDGRKFIPDLWDTRPEPPVVAPVVDKAFRESWVTNPDPVPNLKGLSIETNDAAQMIYPTKFEFTQDNALLIHYYNANGTFWTVRRFDPKTSGLVEGPFGGRYDALAANAKTCARCVAGGVEVWKEDDPTTPRSTLRSPGANYQAGFAPNAEVIVTFATGPGGTPTDVHFYNKSWDELGDVKGQGGTPSSFAWSPDSKTLAVVMSGGNIISLFQSPWTGVTRTIKRPAGVRGLAWSPKGRYLATLEADSVIRVIDAASENGDTVAEVKDFKAVTGPVWSPEGTQLAFGTQDKNVVVWNLESGARARSFSGHKRPLTAVAFLGDGRTLISGSTGSVRFWDLKDNRYKGALLQLQNGGWLALSPQGDYLCSPGAESRFVFVFREEPNDERREMSPEQFRNRYRYTNRPERIKFTGD